MWPSLPGLCCLFLPQFGITDFSAVGDLGQKLANVFYLFFSPCVMRALSRFEKLWSRDLFLFDVAGKSFESNAELLGRFTSGIQFHTGMGVSDS